MKNVLFSILALGLSVSMVFAQTPPAPPVAASSAAATAPISSPAVSDVYLHALQNIDKLAQPLIDQLEPLLKERREVIAEIEKANPGYKWVTNPQSHSEGLMPTAPRPTDSGSPPPVESRKTAPHK
jgi:hypothetical protein